MTLYLIATPIGNLGDITYRAVEILKNVDYILCEDTRHSRKLLDAYQIEKPLKSYHKFNEAQREEEVLCDLAQNQNIALISDAGMPGICDPGQRLLLACQTANLPVTILPGANATMTALVLSGFSSEHVQFRGFLPQKHGACKVAIQELLCYLGTSIVYESPHRLFHTLEIFEELEPTRPLAIARELTKIHEELLKGLPKELLERFSQIPPRGEIVLLVSPQDPSSSTKEKFPDIQDHVRQLQEEHHLSLSEAIRCAADMRGESRRSIYQKIHTHTVNSSTIPEMAHLAIDPPIC